MKKVRRFQRQINVSLPSQPVVAGSQPVSCGIKAIKKKKKMKVDVSVFFFFWIEQEGRQGQRPTRSTSERWIPSFKWLQRESFSPIHRLFLQFVPHFVDHFNARFSLFLWNYSLKFAFIKLLFRLLTAFVGEDFFHKHAVLYTWLWWSNLSQQKKKFIYMIPFSPKITLSLFFPFFIFSFFYQ